MCQVPVNWKRPTRLKYINLYCENCLWINDTAIGITQSRTFTKMQNNLCKSMYRYVYDTQFKSILFSLVLQAHLKILHTTLSWRQDYCNKKITIPPQKKNCSHTYNGLSQSQHSVLCTLADLAQIFTWFLLPWRHLFTELCSTDWIEFSSQFLRYDNWKQWSYI